MVVLTKREKLKVKGKKVVPSKKGFSTFSKNESLLITDVLESFIVNTVKLLVEVAVLSQTIFRHLLHLLVSLLSHELLDPFNLA